MARPNPYQIRHLIKLVLIGIVVTFLLYSSIYLFCVKRFYIRRYVQLYMKQVESAGAAGSIPPILADMNYTLHAAGTWLINGQNKVLQADEEEGGGEAVQSTVGNSIDKQMVPRHPNSLNDKEAVPLPIASRLQSVLHSRTGSFANGEEDIHSAPVEPFNVSGGDDQESSGEGDSDNWSRINLVTGGIVTVVLLIECLYCSLYLYIIHQERFCPVLCFAILTLLSLLFHVQQYLIVLDTPNAEQTSSLDPSAANHSDPVLLSEEHPKLVHESAFFEHVSHLDMESCIGHMTKSGIAEVVLASVESLLAIVFTVLVRLYPGNYRNHRYFHYGYRQNGATDPTTETDLEGYPMQTINGSGDPNAIELNRLRSGSPSSADHRKPSAAAGDPENATQKGAEERQRMFPNSDQSNREMAPLGSIRTNSEDQNDADDLSESLLRRASSQRPSASILSSHKLATMAKMG